MKFLNIISIFYLITTALTLNLPRAITNSTIFISGVCERMYRTCVQTFHTYRIKLTCYENRVAQTHPTAVPPSAPTSAGNPSVPAAKTLVREEQCVPTTGTHVAIH
ncbi:hypothetical protein E6O75_ATG11065 [Venturia nashicola]|uniref:Secreted protein n=1 Tax=Venturia nashicola TaxID=86259 RepID=A0A4Z1PBQ6_9PEZI|nr:hypothetical protein E6O75_ATG11065 [Venturia nashicola]